MKPFLRWAGSKRRLIPYLRPHWNTSFSRFVEPFAGSASMFFELEPESALLADVNLDLMNTYRVVRDNCDSLIEELYTLPIACKETYLELRAKDPKTLTPLASAARFVYLNRNCFNGLYRTNLKGQFNVPFSASAAGTLPLGAGIRACSVLLQRAELSLSSFDETLSLTRPGDFVYIDPPYVDSSTRIFKEYAADGFCQRRIDDLRSHLVRLAEENIFFVLSFTESDEGRFLGSGFSTQKVQVNRSIAGNAMHRRSVPELIITPT